MTTKCAYCDTHLGGNDSIHSAYGKLYCSERCAIHDIMDDIIINAKEAAIEQYNDGVEIVTARELGIVEGSFDYLVRYIMADRNCDEETARHVAYNVMDGLDHAIDMAMPDNDDEDDEEWFDESCD